MFATEHRQTPLILVASGDVGTADEVVRRLRRSGSVAYAAHSAEGALRVATSVGPDLVLLDTRLPRRVESLLKAHPRTAGSTIVHLSPDSVRDPAASLVRPLYLPAA